MVGGKFADRNNAAILTAENITPPLVRSEELAFGGV
nr:MAG TPA: hypothetical protein [Bacteriophage sp.]